MEPLQIVQGGVYQHYKDGEFYQLHYTAAVRAGVAKADVELDVIVSARASNDKGGMMVVGPWVAPAPWPDSPTNLKLEKARSHGKLEQGDVVCVYTPLYAHKNGLRTSARLLREFCEKVCSRCGVGENERQRSCGTEAGHDMIPRFKFLGPIVPLDSREASMRRRFNDAFEFTSAEHKQKHKEGDSDCLLCAALDEVQKSFKV